MRALFERLDRHVGEVPLSELHQELEAAELSFGAVRELCVFDERCYCRNLLHQGPGYCALLLCWRPGQRSPIHDHRGSACAFRIMRGEVTEVVYELDPEQQVHPVATHRFGEGSVCSSFDMDIHEVANEAPVLDLVTLHVYSPALVRMGTYEIGRPGCSLWSCAEPCTTTQRAS